MSWDGEPVNTRASAGGIGFFGLLTLVFIVLKLTGVITWSWVWVLAPFWGPVLFIVLVVLIISFLLK